MRGGRHEESAREPCDDPPGAAAVPKGAVTTGRVMNLRGGPAGAAEEGGGTSTACAITGGGAEVAAVGLTAVLGPGDWVEAALLEPGPLLA